MKRHVWTIMALVASIFSSGAGAQEGRSDLGPISYLPSLAGDYFPMRSKAVGRDYHVFVRLPENYGKDTAARFPVVYVLDGDSLFPLLAPTHLFLTYDEKLPEAIIVGIAYGGFGAVNKRGMDFSAPASDATADQGGAPKFLAFMKTELLPAVEGKFRADPSRRILLGQSRGADFVLWSALEDPDLFWGRIASNPALAPGKARYFEKASANSRRDLKVAVMSGSRDKEARRTDAREWTHHWLGQSVKPWEVKLFSMSNGTHAATIGESYRQAMQWLFPGNAAE